ncbi:MAG: hypothetical protein ACLFTA_00690 [Candidatus Nanohaloarchaea archaeon]
MKVVDANVLIHGRGLDGKLVTVPEVIDELKSGKARKGLSSHSVEAREPGKEKVEEVAQKSGEINSRTSKADEKLLALSLELGEPILTDDKELQNLALHMDAKVEGFLDPLPEEKLSWKMECPRCGKKASGCGCGATPQRRIDQRSPV